jgi:uncharacterized iron-regulated protein
MIALLARVEGIGSDVMPPCPRLLRGFAGCSGIDCMRPLLLLALLLAACSGQPPGNLSWDARNLTLRNGPEITWASAFGVDHPLAGRIWQPAQERYVEPEAVAAALRTARFVLLGEKHDNIDHHRIQAWLLSTMVRDGRRPAVAFEMFTTDQEEILSKYLAVHPDDAAGLGDAVSWAQTGWPDWALYQPVVQQALDAGAPLLAAGLPRGTLRAIARQGLGALGDEQVASLGLDQPLPPEDAARLRIEIIENHCHQLPDSMIDPMLSVTAAKDVHMAATLVRGAQMANRDSAVLVAGSGHARSDRGVPWHLRRMAPGRQLVAIGLLEVSQDEVDPASYVAGFHADGMPFDFVWFTPRTDDSDPCEVYAEQLRRAKERHLEQQTE